MKSQWIEISTDVMKRGLGWPHATRVYERAGLRVVVSDDDEYDESGDQWRHVSFSRKSRLPDWKDFVAVREAWFAPEAVVIQVFPPQNEYKNHHPFCLHFWENKSRPVLPREIRKMMGLCVAV